MAKPMNHRRRVKLLESTTLTPRNPVALAMSQRRGQGRHPDKRKSASKRACRGRYRGE